MKVSVIIPVYNGVLTIKRCLDSILQQTFNDFEIIVINDGSTDSTIDVLLAYEEIDSRIRVLTIPNSGVSHARNVGLLNAKGEWICFIDADDYVLPNYMSSMLEVSIGVDFVISGFKTFGKSEIECKYDQSTFDTRQDVNKIIDSKNLVKSLFYYPWRKLYRKSIIDDHNIRFEENLKLAEDSCFCIKYFCFVQKVSFCESTSYRYYVTEGSKHMLDSNQFIEHSNILAKYQQHLLSVYRNPFSVIISMLQRALLGHFISYVISSADGGSIVRKGFSWHIFKDYVSNAFRSKVYRLAIQYIFVFALPNLYLLVRNKWRE